MDGEVEVNKQNGAVKVKTIYTDILKSNIELATDIEEES